MSSPISSFICLQRALCLRLLLTAAVTLAFIISIGISTHGTSLAADGGGAKTTLDEFISVGLKENPALKAKRLAWKRTIKRYPQARALEDPVLSYTQPIEEVETRLGPIKRSIMLSQKLPFPGKLRLKGKIVNKDIEIARASMEKASRDLILNIKKTYFELYYLDKAIGLAGERIEVFNHFSRAEMNDYSVGSAGLSDVVSAETRYADAKYDLILFTELRRAASGKMNSLLNREIEMNIPSVEEPRIDEAQSDLNELYRLAKGHEELRMAGLVVEKNQLKEKLSKLSSMPNFMIGVNYTEIGEPAMSGVSDGGQDAYGVKVGMTLPIWIGKNRGARSEARLARLSSIQMKKALSNSLDARVKGAYVDMRSNYQLVRLYLDSLLPKASKLIDTVEINYKNGNGSIADLFESKAMWINFSLAYHRAVSNYMKNRAELERLTTSYGLKEVASND